MQKISAVISAYNEEKNIEDCLASLKGFADEIIIIDNTSQDKTKELAKKFTDKIFVRPNDAVMLNKNKNFGFEKASGEWILSLDADERLTDELKTEIKKSLKDIKVDGYEIPRKNIIFNKWIKNSIWWPDYNLRLFRNGKGSFPEKHVHEKLVIDGNIKKLTNPMIHYNYQTISQFIKKMDNTYTESEVENFIKSGKNINWYDAVKFPLDDFLKTFFAQKGYKDGIHGLVLSMLQAFYAFIVFAKVWEKKENFKDITPENFLLTFIRQLKAHSKDIRYWILTSQLDEGNSKRLILRLKRKFR